MTPRFFAPPRNRTPAAKGRVYRCPGAHLLQPAFSRTLPRHRLSFVAGVCTCGLCQTSSNINRTFSRGLRCFFSVCRALYGAPVAILPGIWRSITLFRHLNMVLLHYKNLRSQARIVTGDHILKFFSRNSNYPRCLFLPPQNWLDMVYTGTVPHDPLTWRLQQCRTLSAIYTTLRRVFSLFLLGRPRAPTAH